MEEMRACTHTQGFLIGINQIIYYSPNNDGNDEQKLWVILASIFREDLEEMVLSSDTASVV